MTDQNTTIDFKVLWHREKARVAELEAENRKAAQEWLHLDAANRVLIEENKRLRKYADWMLPYVSRVNDFEAAELEGAYLKDFPRDEAKHG